MNVYGELARAQLENLTADPSPGSATKGRAWYRTDVNKLGVDTGSVAALLPWDFGNSRWNADFTVYGVSAYLIARSSATLETTGEAVYLWDDSAQTQSYLGFDARNDRKMRWSFSSGTSTINAPLAFHLTQFTLGDFWNIPLESYQGTGNITSGSPIITSVSSALTAKLYAGMRVFSGTQLTDVIASVNDATHFTLTTGGAYPTTGGKIFDQDTGTSLTYSAYNSGTKQMTVASTTGLLAGDTTYASVGIPYYSRISSVGATTITLDSNADSSVTGITYTVSVQQIGSLTMCTVGSRGGNDEGLLNLYFSSPLANPQSGALFIHNNDALHTPGRTCGITFFGDGPLTTRGSGPAGCPIGALNFYVENDNPGPVGTGAFQAYVCDGTNYNKFLDSDHSGNVSVGASSSSANVLNGSITISGSLKSDTANIATTGFMRLANNGAATDSISWRNAANGANISIYLDSSDRLQLGSHTAITGVLAVGVNTDTSKGLLVSGSALTGAGQTGIYASVTFNSSATGGGQMYQSSPSSAAAAFTMAYVLGFFAENAVKGATSGITRQVSYYNGTPTSGTNNAVHADNLSFTGNYLFNYSNTNPSLLSGALGIGAVAVASAILAATSTTKGFLPPVMTTAQKNAISSPAAGLIVYDSTLGKLCVFGAATWETITSV